MPKISSAQVGAVATAGVAMFWFRRGFVAGSTPEVCQLRVGAENGVTAAVLVFADVCRFRTPDLLHAIQGRTVAGRGQESPDVAAACDNCGWMRPCIGGCPTMLAPTLAPSQIVSHANVRMTAQSNVGPDRRVHRDIRPTPGRVQI